MKKIDVKQLLFEITENERVFDDNCDLIQNNIMDSYTLISLLSSLEDEGIEIFPTRIDRSMLNNSKSIQQLVDDYIKQHK